MYVCVCIYVYVNVHDSICMDVCLHIHIISMHISNVCISIHVSNVCVSIHISNVCYGIVVCMTYIYVDMWNMYVHM